MKFKIGDRVVCGEKVGFITNVKTFCIAINGTLMLYKEPIYRVYTLDDGFEAYESELTKA